MHPARAIRGRRSRLLDGRTVVVAVSGSIAAVEVPRIIRELLRHGAEVVPVMSPEATRLVTPESVHFAAGRPPILSLTGEVEHVLHLGPGPGRADLLLVAPATANTIAKIAHGIDDTVVTSFASVALGGGVPILVAPAMHADMGRNPAVRDALDRLRSWGVGVIAPVAAEGEEKIASPEEVAAAVLHRLGRGPWSGRAVLVIGGASRERIDDVRTITNESSGETAVALAAQAHYRGAEVTLWLGGVRVPVPAFLAPQAWFGVEELRSWVGSPARWPSGTAAVIVPAALSDYTLDAVPGKIPSRDRRELALTLRRAPKILPELRRAAPAPAVVVGFKLEAGESEPTLLAHARELLREADLDFVVANDVRNMGAADATVFLLGRDGRSRTLRGTKADVAAELLDAIGPALATPAPVRPVPPTGSGTAPERTPRHRARTRRSGRVRRR